jgi:oligopeptide transport system permease protein
MAYPDWTVREVIGGSFPVSLQLGAFALAVAVLGGTALGVLGAAMKHSIVDYTALGIAVVGISLPLFVIAEIALILLAVLWPVVPLGGWGGPRTLILPGLILSLPFMAYIARLTRASMLDVLGLEFVRTARAKGAAPAGVILDHAFRNAFLPVLSYLGPAAAGIFTGSFIVEKIFRIPGLGTHFVQSALNGDQTLALGIVMLYAALLVLFNLFVDVCYAVIDPRIRLAHGRPT